MQTSADIDGTLSAKQQKALAALLAMPTIKAAAEHAGVSESALYGWLRDDQAFIKAYRIARRENVKHVIAHMQQGAHDMVDVLRNVAMSAKTPASARVSAASKYLDVVLKATELDDLAARIEALEHAMQQQQQ